MHKKGRGGKKNNKLLISVCIKQEQVFISLFYPLSNYKLSLGYKEFTRDIYTFFTALYSPIINIYTVFFLPITTTTKY